MTTHARLFGSLSSGASKSRSSGERRARPDARRALAEADLRRLIEDEDRLRAREDQRRRAAADDVERLRALVASAAETIQSTKVNITRQTQQRTQEEQVNVEREEARRVAAATEIRRVEADVEAAREQEEERRAAFDERLRGMAAEEERRREEELARIATFDAQIVELEEAELVTVREEEKTLAELRERNYEVLVHSDDVHGQLVHGAERELAELLSVRTDYESRWIEEGRRIHYIQVRV